MLAISVITLVTKSREAFHNGPRHNNKNNASLLEGGTLTRKNVFHGFLRFGGGRNQQPLVGLEFLNPILNVAHGVLERFLAIQTSLAAEEGSTEFGYEFFLAITVRTEVACYISIQTGGVARGVGGLMEKGEGD